MIKRKPVINLIHHQLLQMKHSTRVSIHTQTSIYITDKATIGGKDYEYKDDIRRSKTGHVIAWHGQKNGRKDRFVGIGTGVFYRKRPNLPFTWLGRINHIELMSDGQRDGLPDIYLLKVPFDKDTFKTFPTEEKGSGRFKKSAQIGMGYTVTSSYLSGIIYHGIR